ncbi:ATP-grasp domain-containing protein [Stutzerimonas nitrititolerans]|uniref:ATP-grasp domain-containing protein n=1 Tax=Stutzerimonas nitrititolerans TaxID=2482751 RepID=UPI002897F630|nr:ATP-grasp domain-containing protein [Stutzerimonas nitrititolerans]
MNVLVFPCGSEIGLEIHAALCWQKDVRLYGASSVVDHGELVYANYRKISASVDSDDFIAQMNDLVREWGIDIIMPAHDSVFLRLAEALSADELSTLAAVPALWQARICRNKNETYTFLSGCNFIPECSVSTDGHYPIFAKPAVSQGSQGAEVVHDASRHMQLLENGIEYVFSEYLPGVELTVDCLSDKEGLLKSVSPRQRCRIKSGISVRTQPVPLDEAITSIAEQIAQKLQLKGAWFFQLRQDIQGKWKLLEIAPRIAGSMGMSRHLGINYPLLTLYAYLGVPFGVISQYYPIVMERALCSRYQIHMEYDQVYVDLDDTLIHRGRVHPVLVSLLYQWSDRGIPVHLITRHNESPVETLEKYRVAKSLFSSIIHVVDGLPKSKYMSEGRGVFIDDSFRERLEVRGSLNFWVFDLDSIDQLIDWRE